MKMAEKERLTFRKGDAVAIGATVFLAVAMMAFFLLSGGEESAGTVQVYQDGVLLQEMRLTENRELLVTGNYENRIVIRDGRAAIVSSTCPGEDCVHSGWISQAGRSVFCLPNRVEVRIAGAVDEDEVDAVVR